MRSQGQMHRTWGILLRLIVVVLVAITPMLEPVCDTVSGDGHHRGHVHTIPAITAQGPAAPGVPSIGAALPARPVGHMMVLAPSIFVPPRS